MKELNYSNCAHIHLNLYEKLEEFKYFRKSNYQEIFHNCSWNLADFRKTIDLYYKILYSANLENHFRGGLTENVLQYLLRTYCIHADMQFSWKLEASQPIPYSSILHQNLLYKLSVGNCTDEPSLFWCE